MTAVVIKDSLCFKETYTEVFRDDVSGSLTNSSENNLYYTYVDIGIKW